MESKKITVIKNVVEDKKMLRKLKKLGCKLGYYRSRMEEIEEKIIEFETITCEVLYSIDETLREKQFNYNPRANILTITE